MIDGSENFEKKIGGATKVFDEELNKKGDISEDDSKEKAYYDDDLKELNRSIAKAKVDRDNEKLENMRADREMRVCYANKVYTYLCLY